MTPSLYELQILLWYRKCSQGAGARVPLNRLGKSLGFTRFVLRNGAGGRCFRHSWFYNLLMRNLEEIMVHVNKEQEKDREKFVDRSIEVQTWNS